MLLSFFFFFFFLPHYMTCGILVPRLGTESKPSAVKAWSPNQWTTREFLRVIFFFLNCLSKHCPRVRVSHCSAMFCSYIVFKSLELEMFPLFVDGSVCCSGHPFKSAFILLWLSWVIQPRVCAHYFRSPGVSKILGGLSLAVFFTQWNFGWSSIFACCIMIMELTVS